MSVVAAVAEELKARVAPASRGHLFTFERDGRWHTMTARWTPQLTMSVPAPGLVGLELEARFGLPTVLAVDGRADDARWDVRTRDRDRALALFDEAPWPEDLTAPPGPISAAPSWYASGLARIFFGPMALIGAALAGGGRTPARPANYSTEHFVLTVEHEVATLERKAGADDVASAVGMARRLIQLVTRPARREAEIAAATPLNNKGNAPYR